MTTAWICYFHQEIMLLNQLNLFIKASENVASTNDTEKGEQKQAVKKVMLGMLDCKVRIEFQEL